MRLTLGNTATRLGLAAPSFGFTLSRSATRLGLAAPSFGFPTAIIGT
jgi:hypothetical protein